jgi:lipopolysaccharide export LptBFGC system permease protein LptF
MSLWDDISGLAPTLIAALTGNIPAAAASAAAFIAKQFGWINSSPAAVKQQLAALTPDQLIKLQELEVQFAQISNDSEDMEIGDNQDARSTKVQLAKMGYYEHTTSYLSYLIIVAFFSLIICLFIFPIPKENTQAVYTLIGVLGTIAVAVVSFWFGTSQGSKIKTAIIQSQLDKSK